MSEADLEAAVWGSPYVVDNKLMIGDEDGVLSIFALGKKEKIIRRIAFNSSVYTTASVADNILYITDRSQLYAFKKK